MSTEIKATIFSFINIVVIGIIISQATNAIDGIIVAYEKYRKMYA